MADVAHDCCDNYVFCMSRPSAVTILLLRRKQNSRLALSQGGKGTPPFRMRVFFGRTLFSV